MPESKMETKYFQRFDRELIQVMLKMPTTMQRETFLYNLNKRVNSMLESNRQNEAMEPTLSTKIGSKKFSITVISTEEGLKQIEKILLDAKILIIDCEWNMHEELCLLQILPIDLEEAYIFDMIGCSYQFRTSSLKFLKYLLEDSTKLKVLHDQRGDERVLFHQGIYLKPTLDTQTYLSTTKRIGLGDLLSRYGLPTKPCLNHIYSENPNYWSQRPLTKDMIEYAGNDVVLLLELIHKSGLYKVIQDYYKNAIVSNSVSLSSSGFTHLSSNHMKFVGPSTPPHSHSYMNAHSFSHIHSSNRSPLTFIIDTNTTDSDSNKQSQNQHRNQNYKNG